MGVRNVSREELRRLESKSLDARFLREVQTGLNCSPFEAQAVLNVVRDVYFPLLDESVAQAPPGKISLVAVCADEPAGKSIAECEKRTVSLTIHRGAQDDRILVEKGPMAFRRLRISDLCQEALSQGALVTREDLARHVFFVGPRTISRDLAVLRREHPEVPLPLRGTVQDIGPVLTHRVQVVRLALEGKTTTQIRDILHHSPKAIANYLSTFARCAHLVRRGLQPGQIAFLLRRGKGLVRQYLDLLHECERDANFAYHLQEILRLGESPEAGGKKAGRRSAHGRRP
jgi:hypothetical protein